MSRALTRLHSRRYPGAVQGTRYPGLWLLAAASALGQHAGGLPSLTPIPAVRMPAPGLRVGPRASFARNPAPFFPVYFGGYDEFGYTASTPAPNVLIVQQPPAYLMLQEAPRQTAAGEVHEYTLAPSTPPAATDEEPPAFAIVLRDGSVHSAAAVTVQDDVLHYVEPDGRHMRVALSAVDREATQRRNRDRKLNLQLPPASR